MGLSHRLEEAKSYALPVWIVGAQGIVEYHDRNGKLETQLIQREDHAAAARGRLP